MKPDMSGGMPSPENILATFSAYQRTAALRGAIELDLFTAIGEGKSTVAALAAHCQAAERGIRILCDYLAVNGFLAKKDGQYILSTEAAFYLDRRSPACIADASRFLTSPMTRGGFRDIAATVRHGGTLLDSGGCLAPEHPVWVEFARGMAPLMAPLAGAVADLLTTDRKAAWKVLDVAAGHGLFGISIGSHNPQAEIVALDWPAVLQVARANAEHAGLGHRFHTIAGDVFDVDVGSDYDLVLLPNFLHHFAIDQCHLLLRKAHRALRSTGRVVIVEFVPDEDRMSPPETVAFGLIMLATTPSGDAYTFLEYEKMLSESGFCQSELHTVPGLLQRVIIGVKAS